MHQRARSGGFTAGTVEQNFAEYCRKNVRTFSFFRNHLPHQKTTKILAYQANSVQITFTCLNQILIDSRIYREPQSTSPQTNQIRTMQEQFVPD